MRAEIIAYATETSREVWIFILAIDWSNGCIYFDRFEYQTRATKRHKWAAERVWDRLHGSKTGEPTIPQEIRERAIKEFQTRIAGLTIKGGTMEYLPVARPTEEKAGENKP